MKQSKSRINKGMATRKDMVGQRFGRLIIIAPAGHQRYKKERKSKPALWLCRCDCGNEIIRQGIYIRKGNNVSCGCTRNEMIAGIGASSVQDSHPNWKGGRSSDGKGYIVMSAGLARNLYPGITVQRKIYEHRAVMAFYLGRDLYDNETIHHKNGVRNDNRIENLELRVGNHGPGSTPEEAVAWAKEILKRYS